MTDKTMESRNLDGNYFKLIYSRKSDKDLQYYLDQFDINDWYIYKSSGHQRQVSIKQLYDFNYSAYIFFKKSEYSNLEINEWLNFLKSVKISLVFLNKPFPPKHIQNKINII